MILGERRDELPVVEAWEAYGQGYGLDHYFRFGKQRLLAAYQTRKVDHEENYSSFQNLVLSR